MTTTTRISKRKKEQFIVCFFVSFLPLDVLMYQKNLFIRSMTWISNSRKTKTPRVGYKDAREKTNKITPPPPLLSFCDALN